MHTPLHEHARLGIDIGRVIIGAVGEDGTADTSFLGGSEADALATQAETGAFDTIRALVDRLDGRVWLVSKCGARVQALTRRWLLHHEFHTLTELPVENLRFCKERPQKRDIAATLELTHFIDDRLDVLRHLDGLVPSLYWFGRQSARPPDWVVPARDWRKVRRLLLPELRDEQVFGGDVIDEPDRRAGDV